MVTNQTWFAMMRVRSSAKPAGPENQTEQMHKQYARPHNFLLYRGRVFSLGEITDISAISESKQHFLIRFLYVFMSNFKLGP